MRWFLSFLLLFVLPIVLSIGFIYSARAEHWSRARWDATGLAPTPAEHPDAVVQVYAARTWGWKGAFAVHSWIVLKPEGASVLRPLRGGRLGRRQRRALGAAQSAPTRWALGRQRP